ncbi:uncharacterized protein LOC113273084 [Papaver somniferum]|uniref:uncharacterized protein LOC113273084 n=1 Tax=Papaver somniferum TaxID=3469 RepID=UPI000E6FF3DE|nr:uncharacterized protein LOC113273084 [Papaver somniferum]
MNPLKCAFGVSSGKFPGFLVTAEGIKVDPDKTKAITTMPPPCTVKELQSFMGKPDLIGRPSKWLLQMSEFDIACVPPRAIKGQAVSDLLAAFPGENTTTLHEDLPGAEKKITVQRRTVLSTWLAQVEDIQANDWRETIIHELSNSLSEGKVGLEELKNYFLLHGALYYRNPDGSLSRCLGKDEAGEQLKRIHEEICGKTLVDISGKINPASSKQHEYIITATEYFTKWVEAIYLRSTTGVTIAAFIKEYIICIFGVPKQIVIDNGTLFAKKHVTELLEEYDIKQVFSTPYYPQENGQAESINKTLIWILSRTIHDNPRTWHEKLPMAL